MNCLWQKMGIENNSPFPNLLCVRMSCFVCASVNLKYVLCETKVYLLYAEYPGYAALLTWFIYSPYHHPDVILLEKNLMKNE